MRRMGTATEEELAGFRLLLNAVLKTPELVPGIVREKREILEYVNNGAETVLHWLAVEDDVDGIRLLHSLGASIPEFALIEAVQSGHLATADALLQLGARLGLYSLDGVMGNPLWDLSESTKQQLTTCFLKHGYVV